MSNTSTNPLPDGFIDDLLDHLHGSTRYHLIKHLGAVNTPSSPASHNKPSSTQELQHVIFSNISCIGDQFLSKNGHNLDHILLLWRLISQGHFSNLVELDLGLGYNITWHDGSQQSLLDELNSLAPFILRSLPRLESLTFPSRSYFRPYTLFFSLPGLFPTGQQSSHLENLCLSASALKKADLKYLALHSNYMFPLLTNLDVVSLFFLGDSTDNADDTADVHSSMYYLLQWVEKSMPKLSHLGLSECELTTTDIATDLANSPILSRLESLDLSDNSDVEAESWKTLFSSSQFTDAQDQDCGEEDPNGFGAHHNAKLQTLSLERNPNIKSVLPLLTQNCSYLTNLTTLDLNSCDLDDNSIQSLCNSKWIRGLESLSLGYNKGLTSESIRMISDCDGMQNLTYLNFNGRRSGQFSVDLLRYTTQSQQMPNPTTINIDLTGISYDESIDQVLLDFFHSPKATALTHLFLNCDSIPQSTLKSILLSPMLSNLEIVRFSSLSSNNGWFDAFVSSPNCCRLHRLSLSNGNLTNSNILSISQSPHLSSLCHLDLHNNPALTDDSVKYLVQSEVLRLNTLGLSSNPLLTPLTLHHLAQSPQFVSRLEELWVSECPLIGKEDRDTFVKAGWFDGQISC